MSSYMDFLGETIAESYRTGKIRKPDLKNALAKSRSKFRTKIEKEANEQGRDVSEVALDYVKENAGQIAKYVMSKGELPQDENPMQLAIQAWTLRQDEVNDIANAIQCDQKTAEAFLDEAENRAMEINSPEADSFIGEIFDAIGRVAGKGLKKASDNRVAKGKKPGVAGFFADLLNPELNGTDKPDTTVSIKDELGKVYSDIKASETKSAIKQYLPLIIIGIVVIILITYLAARKK